MRPTRAPRVVDGLQPSCGAIAGRREECTYGQPEWSERAAADLSEMLAARLVWLSHREARTVGMSGVMYVGVNVCIGFALHRQDLQGHPSSALRAGDAGLRILRVR